VTTCQKQNEMRVFPIAGQHPATSHSLSLSLSFCLSLLFVNKVNFECPADHECVLLFNVFLGL
jgi:hypothetical protein